MNVEVSGHEIMVTSKFLVFVLRILISMSNNSIVLKRVKWLIDYIVEFYKVIPDDAMGLCVSRNAVEKLFRSRRTSF